ncbi:MAG: CoA activase [Deltaproteobacteria bacterium]|nr:CoA activase [Deltaproteobacteria bacterium]MBW1963400.1 CoA activase [Deltaproteobacteria bacterium]MBW1993696.1 CoA activase [Deltaproteobacteria bacterium]MBW2150331.1 CoA activase [Deltaproteobacteria bacterium]
MTEKNAKKVINFQSLTEKVGRFDISGSQAMFLIPEMNRIGGHLLAATFRGFGIRSRVIGTYKGLDLGKEHTSGKECYPCQITTGDILYFLKKEKERLGKDFLPQNYIYFMPEAGGPCRFGMYNKYQRIVLDSFPEFRHVKIGSLTTSDGYSLDGLINPERVSGLRKAGYLSIVVTDVLERLLWRIRPYEIKPGITDEFIEKSMHIMEACFERYGAQQRFDKIIDRLESLIEEGKSLIKPDLPRKPLIGIVGEIYLRHHVHANQDLIRLLEHYGAEVVNASLAEWVNYTSYDRLREAKTAFRFSLKQMHLNSLKAHLKDILKYGGDLLYQQQKQKQVYKRAEKLIDIQPDHKVGHLEEILKENDIYSFDAGTEACLSISGIIQYAREGFNGVVNVYPFTCMPSTITSAIIKPLMNELRIPYLDTPYDGSFQPGREAAIRTFMYQAIQHFNRNGGKPSH